MNFSAREFPKTSTPPPVIGRVTTRPLALHNLFTGEREELPGQTYEVVHIGRVGRHKTYVTNHEMENGCWLVVIEPLVASYEAC